jgi:hypothetical protein
VTKFPLAKVFKLVKPHAGDALIAAGSQVLDLAEVRAKFGPEIAAEALRRIRAELARRHATIGKPSKPRRLFSRPCAKRARRRSPATKRPIARRRPCHARRPEPGEPSPPVAGVAS